MNDLRTIFHPTVLSCVRGALQERFWSFSRSHKNSFGKALGTTLSHFYDLGAIAEWKRLPIPLRYRIIPLGLICLSGGLIKKYEIIDLNILHNGLHLSLIAGNFALDKNAPLALTRFAIWTSERLSNKLPPSVKKISDVAFRVLWGYWILNRIVSFYDKQQYFKLAMSIIGITLVLTGMMKKIEQLALKNQEEMIKLWQESQAEQRRRSQTTSTASVTSNSLLQKFRESF